MLRFLGKLPQNKIYVAYSGGVDSTAILTFLKNTRNVTAAFFNHKTKNSVKALEHCKKFCNENNIPLVVGEIEKEKDPTLSWEEYWRIERYKFLHSLDGTVITGHNLDDVMETWIFSTIHGTPKLIPYRNKNVIRPFMITKKEDFKEWCIRKNFKWIEDESNKDTKYARNKIRHDIMPNILEINPGFYKVIYKKLINTFN